MHDVTLPSCLGVMKALSDARVKLALGMVLEMTGYCM